MAELPSYAKNFANFRVYEAVCRTGDKEEEILIEFRGSADEKELVFTVIDRQPIRATSIHELVHMLPQLVSLTIRHSLRILWNDEIRVARFTEIFGKSENSSLPQVASLRVRLDVDGRSYQSTGCDTLMDAISELDDAIQPEARWSLLTCYECAYAGYARHYILSDREYWCYRDVPEAIAGIRAGIEYANQETRFEGAYFVHAFHACAAWQPRRRIPADLPAP